MQILSLLSLIADPNSRQIDSAASTRPEAFWSPLAVVVCAVGLSILFTWLGRYGGFSALRHAPMRRNRMVGFVPIILLVVWLMLMMVISQLIKTFFGSKSEFFQQALSYPAMLLLELALIGVMLVIARVTFARRLKGFGLDVRTAGKDAGFAVVYLLAVYPLILLALWAVLTIGRLVNENFGLEVHQSLTFLSENTHIGVQILAVIFAVVVVPIFEEMLFRGFLQTSIRSVTQSPWAAIVMTSLLFAILHPMTHIPALFCLACGLGYAYERSGSLYRSIFMHIFFNGFSVAATFWMT